LRVMTQERILVIDDEPAIPELIELLLKPQGFQILKAFSGADGIRVASEEHPDLMLLDVMMPDIDGFEVLKRIKDKKIPTRVIMVTAYGGTIPDVVRFIKAGACDYLLKPVNPVEIIRAVKRALAIDTTINLQVSDTSPIVEELIARAEKLAHDNSQLQSQVKAIPERKHKHLLIMIMIRLLCFAIGVGVTLLLLYLNLIPRNTWAFVLPFVIFLILLLPIESVKKMYLKAPKAETGVEM
jgi:DNA-binding response OmpR family regulator